MDIFIDPNFQDDDFNPATPDVNVPIGITDYDESADDSEDIADFSGRGPTDDGRIKPDIVAPGTSILSCRSQVSTADVGPDGVAHAGGITGLYADDADGVDTHNEAVGTGLPGGPFFGTWNQNTPACPAGSGPNCQQNYFYNQGTSMAAPLTTGTTALLRQYLRERRGVNNPSAALMKALLINGATVPVGASNSPDNDRGFGWLNLENTLIPVPTGQQAFSDDVDLAVATGDVRTFSVQLAQTGHPFRVTLVWNDKEGSGIQNQLYLRVITPTATVIDGDLTAFPTVENNVQRVHIEAPDPGLYTIEVHGILVPFGIDAHLPDIRQDFALAVINGIGFSPEPVDVCQVIDKSGSMGTYGYIDPVRERSKQFVDVLRINDRTGAVAFNSTSSVVHPLVPVDGFPTKESIKTAINGLSAGGTTSIGAGLQEGQSQLSSGGDPSHPQAIMLLSDGHENTPPWVGGGVTDSPPSWYIGTDLTEVLPTIPASTKVYTISLGVQSDQILLQDIATLTGGVFHAIHSLADIGELHEIYVHLQALTGGEEVISSGTDSVNGLNIGVFRGIPSIPSRGGSGGASRLPMFDRMIDMRKFSEYSKKFKMLQPKNDHTIYVDDTLSSVTMIVSWHDPQYPVSLSVITPSGKTYSPRSSRVFNHTGSSYQFYYFEKPEPGKWIMRIKANKSKSREGAFSAKYTWGAYGKSPIGIGYKLPKKLMGIKKLKVAVNLKGVKHVKQMKFGSYVTLPQVSLDVLTKRYKRMLDSVDLSSTAESPKTKTELYRLASLDRKMVLEGKKSIFKSQKRSLNFTKTNKYVDTIITNVPGLHKISLAVTGRTKAGYLYQRQSRFNVHIAKS